MKKEELRELFKKTGNLNYFLTYRKMVSEGRDKIEYNSSNGDNNKRKTL